MSSLPESPRRGVLESSDKWEPDEDVEDCFSCNKEFGAFRRRHHCRSCGHVFCSDCCDKKRQLDVYEAPQRVCHDCDLQIANHNRKQQTARLDADLMRVSADHLARMRSCGTVDLWNSHAPKTDGFDQFGFKLPEGVDECVLYEIEKMENEAESQSRLLWSNFLSPLLVVCLEKGSEQESLGMRFHEVGSAQAVEISEILKGGLCERSNTLLVPGDIILLVEGRSTWADMIEAIKASTTVEMIASTDGSRSRKQKADIEATSLTFESHWQHDRYKHVFREAFASALLRAGAIKTEERPSLVSMFEAGVPAELRSTVYMHCCSQLQGGHLNAQHYVNLVARVIAGDVQTEVIAQIKKDLPRTMSDQKIRSQSEEGVKSLDRILSALALHDPAVGYCQGMNLIGAFLFSFFEEEQVFWILGSLITHITPGYFVRSMIGITTDMHTAAGMIKEHMPELYDHLEMLMPVSILAQNYLQLCFVGALPPATAMRLLDLLMMTCVEDDWRPIHILCAAFLALMERCCDAIMEMEDPQDVIQIIHATAEGRLDSVDFMRWVKRWMDLIDAEQLETVWKQERAQQLSAAQEVLHTQIAPVASDAGLSEENFDQLYGDFMACVRAQGNSKVIDRVSLKRVKFKRLCARQLGDRSDHAFDCLFELFDVDHDGAIDMKECVVGLAALGANSTNVQKVEWLFNVFSNGGDTLDKEQIQTLIQFISIIAGLQLSHCKEPRIVECQRWWVGVGWHETSTTGVSADPGGFVDSNGADVELKLPCENQSQTEWMRKLGWVQIIGDHSDEDGWVYNFSFPSLQEQLELAEFRNENKTHTIARWRVYANQMPEAMMRAAQEFRNGIAGLSGSPPESGEAAAIDKTEFIHLASQASRFRSISEVLAGPNKENQPPVRGSYASSE